LSPTPTRRTERLIAAAEAKHDAGGQSPRADPVGLVQSANWQAEEPRQSAFADALRDAFWEIG
jgi:hypothetical protein